MTTTGHVYREDWHMGIRCWCHDATDSDLASRFGGQYRITYATGLPAIGAATLTRTVTAYSYAAARGAAEEYARKVGNESGAVLAVTGITRL